MIDYANVFFLQHLKSKYFEVVFSDPPAVQQQNSEDRGRDCAASEVTVEAGASGQQLEVLGQLAREAGQLRDS